jgi:predicted phage tail protein
LSLLLTLSLLCLAQTCGKRRPPQPPLERIPQRTEQLTGFQRGNEVILSWPKPPRNASESSVQSIRRVDVYRVAEKTTAPLPMTEEEFAARATLIGSVTYDEIQRAQQNLIYRDALELTEPARLRYAVRYINAAGQRAAFSNFLLIEPAAKIANPPTNVAAEPSETAISIKWEAPTTNVDGSTPVNLLGYDVYRRSRGAAAATDTPLNQAPTTRLEFDDRNFKFGEKYSYFVRSVSLGTLGKPVESLDSNTAEANPVDIYPPSAPARPTIGPSPGRLSLFWAANPEPDVAGYLIYRSIDPNLPKPWNQLTTALWTRTTFTDENVEAGRTYYYYIRAVDTSGNKSDPSEVVSETVP